MGLFSRLFGRNTQQSSWQEVQEHPQRKEKRNFCCGEAELRRRIEKIIAEEWPGYELRKDVPSSVMGAPMGARAFYSYGIYWGESPKAMIMILNNNNAYCRKDVRLARMACEQKKVPYMNFMDYMENRPEYISQRFRENIAG